MLAKTGPRLYLVVAAALAANAAICGLFALRDARLLPRGMAAAIFASGAGLWVIGYFRRRKWAGNNAR